MTNTSNYPDYSVLSDASSDCEAPFCLLSEALVVFLAHAVHHAMNPVLDVETAWLATSKTLSVPIQ